ncbi:ATP synthase F1 subunit gamma [Candidatus Kaiserbacteria bacterium]|nr:MAG: ATP synthase F1 subunit gamma [Candidatus Kaiserbacteria bacterium]
MAGLKQLKLKRQSVMKTRQVTRAMEAVSAVKMRKSQERALGGRAYATGALRILNHVTHAVGLSSHPLFEERATGAVGLIIVTSDKGLAGSLNSAVIKKVDAFLKAPEHKDAEKVFICIGRRGHDYIQNRDLKVIHFEENKNDDFTEVDMERITKAVLTEYEDSTLRSWEVAYTNFQSTFEQEAVTRQLLPLHTDSLEKVIEGITPESGKYSEEEKSEKSFAFTVEPNADEILEAIIPNLVNIFVYHTLLETKASEHSARMVAMKNATDKATELSHELMLKFNKARQAVITSEVSEITSGIEAMK